MNTFAGTACEERKTRAGQWCKFLVWYTLEITHIQYSFIF